MTIIPAADQKPAVVAFRCPECNAILGHTNGKTLEIGNVPTIITQRLEMFCGRQGCCGSRCWRPAK